jgi:drug/metabolite transporter (DMT)-like permease
VRECVNLRAVSARAWTAFGVMSALWGIPYLFIKVAVDDGLSPAVVAWVRVVLGAAVLLTLAARAGTLGALRPKLKWLAVCAVTEVVVPFPLIAAGEQRVDSSVAAIMIACVPLIVALLAIRYDPSERATGVRLAGLVIGLVGVVALVGIDIAGSAHELVGAAAIGVAAIGYAIGPMIIKAQFGDLDPRATMGALLGIAAVVLTPFAAAAPPTETPPGEAIAALLVLGLFCTAAAFVVFSILIAEAGPGRALVITYVNPVVAVALGVTILGERPGAGAVAGLLLILAGSWLSTDGRLPPGLMRRIEGLRAPAAAPPEITRAAGRASWSHG